MSLKEKIQCEYPNILVHVAQMDVREGDAVNRAVAELPEGLKDVDILVNNAGLALGWVNLVDSTDQVIDTLFETNVKGLIRLSRALLPRMLERNAPATIVNIGSIAGTQAYAKSAIYCATKHAVHAISQVLRIELLTSKIRVCEVMPGLVETEFSVVRFEGNKEQAKQIYHGIDALTGQDVAEIVAFVASRPDHVQISQVECLPTNQASVHHIHRES